MSVSSCLQRNFEKSEKTSSKCKLTFAGSVALAFAGCVAVNAPEGVEAMVSNKHPHNLLQTNKKKPVQQTKFQEWKAKHPSARTEYKKERRSYLDILKRFHEGNLQTTTRWCYLESGRILEKWSLAEPKMLSLLSEKEISYTVKCNKNQRKQLQTLAKSFANENEKKQKWFSTLDINDLFGEDGSVLAVAEITDLFERHLVSERFRNLRKNAGIVKFMLDDTEENLQLGDLPVPQAFVGMQKYVEELTKWVGMDGLGFLEKLIEHEKQFLSKVNEFQKIRMDTLAEALEKVVHDELPTELLQKVAKKMSRYVQTQMKHIESSTGDLTETTERMLKQLHSVNSAWKDLWYMKKRPLELQKMLAQASKSKQ